MTATSIFYIQSVNHLEKIHEVRLAYWNTLPLLAPVKFRTSCDRRREKVQTEERKSQVRRIGSEIVLPYQTMIITLMMKMMFMYIWCCSLQRLCFLMARIIAVNGPLWVHCPYVVWQFVFCKRLLGNYQFLLWIEEVCSLYKSNLKLFFFSLLIVWPFSVPTSTVMQQGQQAVTVSLRQTACHSTFPLSTSLDGLSNHLFNRTSLKTQKSKAGRVWSAFKKRDIIPPQKLLREFWLFRRNTDEELK